MATGTFQIAMGKFPFAMTKLPTAIGKFPIARESLEIAIWGADIATGKFPIANAKSDSHCAGPMTERAMMPTHRAITQARWVMIPPTMTPAIRRGR